MVRAEIIHSITLLKDAGFTVGIQLMTGLPGQTPNSIFQGIRELLPLRPDMVRIYPLLVLEGTPLAEMWRHGIYEPQTLVDAVSLVGRYVCGILSLWHPLSFVWDYNLRKN